MTHSPNIIRKRIVSLVALSLALTSAACASHQPGAASEHEPAAPPAEFLAHFDAASGQLPEGLLVTDDAAYVGFAPSSQVARVALSSGVVSPFAQFPAPVSGKGFLTGLAGARDGGLYVGLASFVPEVQAGIYRVGPEGGAGRLFAKDAALPFPNALAFDDAGTLFVSDSGTGSVFRIDAAGNTERWATGELLTGKKYHCGPGLGPGFDIGANGIVVERDAVYVVNTDKATLIEIPRDSAGRAGEQKVVAGPDCVQLGGADGLARAPDGSFIVAINRQDKLTRVTLGGRIETIASGTPLDFPASVAYRGSDLYFTNFALFSASAGKASAAPGLLKLGH